MSASDVLYLHALKDKLDMMLAREGRTDLAEACFRFLPDRARLDPHWAGANRIFSPIPDLRRRAEAIFPSDFPVIWR